MHSRLGTGAAIFLVCWTWPSAARAYQYGPVGLYWLGYVVFSLGVPTLVVGSGAWLWTKARGTNIVEPKDALLLIGSGIAGFFAGWLVFAVGHHLMYEHLSTSVSATTARSVSDWLFFGAPASGTALAQIAYVVVAVRNRLATQSSEIGA